MSVGRADVYSNPNVQRPGGPKATDSQYAGSACQRHSSCCRRVVCMAQGWIRTAYGQIWARRGASAPAHLRKVLKFIWIKELRGRSARFSALLTSSQETAVVDLFGWTDENKAIVVVSGAVWDTVFDQWNKVNIMETLTRLNNLLVKRKEKKAAKLSQQDPESPSPQAVRKSTTTFAPHPASSSSRLTFCS